jgi:hypothetical protein
MMDLLLAVAREVLAPPPAKPAVVIHCGDAAVILNGLAPHLQIYTVLAVEKVITAPEYLAIVAKQFPGQSAKAETLLKVCGVM